MARLGGTLLCLFIKSYIALVFSKQQGSIIVDDLKICDTLKCIHKCCNATEYAEIDMESFEKRCINTNGILDFDNVTVYDDDIYDTGKDFNDIFRLIPGKFSNATFMSDSFEFTAFNLNNYLTEDGIVYLENPNAYKRWTRIEPNSFCVEYQWLYSVNRTEPRFFLLLDSEDIPQSNMFFTTALLISCVFLLLTLIVYALLPELRNLCGMVLMAYVVSLLGAFLFLAVIQMDRHEALTCIGLTMVTYFFFLSSFCWMNIMSFDIWWTFRGYAKARPIHRRGETFKFFMYCLYGWGLPFSMTIGLAILNETDLSKYPWIVTPKIPKMGCFLEGGEKLLYLYVPMLILILTNWILFLMTGFNIWRLSRGTAMLHVASSATHRHRFTVYLRLSVIMGINWILEVISSLKPQMPIWYVTDAYNLLIGLAIFIIFVCKRKVNDQLKRRVSKFRLSKMSNNSQNQNSTSSTMESSMSRDASRVNRNPQYTS